MLSITSKVSIISHLASTPKTTEDVVDAYITIPPDGGWGCLVVAASFLCNFVADGSIYTFGMFLNEIGETFGVPPTTVALGNSLMTGMYYLSGPITCALVNRWGFQITGFIGGAIAGIAFLMSTIVNSIALFLLIFGLVGGFGFGLVYVPSIIVVGFYFERWRALATSIAATGSAAGIIGFPFIIDGALRRCSWQAKFKVIAGGCLISSFLALIYKPLKPVRVVSKDKKLVSEIESGVSMATDQKSGIFTKTFKRYHNLAFPTASQLQKDSAAISYGSESSTSTFITTSFGDESVTSVMKHLPPEEVDKLSTVYEYERCSKCRGWFKRLCDKCKCCEGFCGRIEQNRPMYRDDIFYTGSLYTLSEYTQSRTSRSSKKVNIDYTLSVTRTELRKAEGRKFCKNCPESVIRTLVTMMNFKLLKSPSFCLLTVSGVLTVLGMFVPFIYLIQKADELKIDQNVSYYFLPVLGASNAAGRILNGVIATIPRVKPLLVVCWNLIVCGVATIASYFLTSLSSQFICILIFGATIASISCLTAPIVVEMLGLENLTNAFGLLLLSQGVAALSGIPLAGLIVTATNSYGICFIYSGCCITLGGILLIPVKRVSQWEKRKTQLKI